MTCPICKNKTISEFRPFCSKRCADIDLGKWLGGEYRTPSQDPEDIDKAIETLENAPENPGGKPH